MTVNKSLFALLSFICAAVLFGLATFTVEVGDIDLIAAGLFSCAIGFVLDHLS